MKPCTHCGGQRLLQSDYQVKESKCLQCGRSEYLPGKVIYLHNLRERKCATCGMGIPNTQRYCKPCVSDRDKAYRRRYRARPAIQQP